MPETGNSKDDQSSGHETSSGDVNFPECPTDESARYTGYPHFIPSTDIDLEVVLSYVRTFIDSSAVFQRGVYPSCNAIEGIWIASDGQILLEDARAMMSDSKVWSAEVLPSTKDLSSPREASQKSKLAYNRSVAWRNRLLVGRARRARELACLIMRPQADFLWQLKCRGWNYDSSITPTTESGLVFDNPIPSDPPQGTENQPISSHGELREHEENAEVVAGRQAAILTEDVGNVENDGPSASRQSDSENGESSSIQEICQHRLPVLTGSTNEANNAPPQPNYYGNTTVHGGNVHLGNSHDIHHHNYQAKKDSRIVSAAQHIASGAVGGGLALLGSQTVGSANHVTKNVIDDIPIAMGSTLQSVSSSMLLPNERISQISQHQIMATTAHPPPYDMGTPGSTTQGRHIAEETLSNNTNLNPMDGHAQFSPLSPPIPQQKSSESMLDPMVKDDKSSTLPGLGSPMQDSRSVSVKAIAQNPSHSVLDMLYNDPWLTSRMQDRDADAVPKFGSNQSFSRLHETILCGNSTAIDEVLSHPWCKPNVLDKGGVSPLMIASWCGHSQAVSKLLDIDADVNQGWLGVGSSSTFFSPALKQALVQCHWDIAIMLIKYGALMPPYAWIPDDLLPAHKRSLHEGKAYGPQTSVSSLSVISNNPLVWQFFCRDDVAQGNRIYLLAYEAARHGNGEAVRWFFSQARMKSISILQPPDYPDSTLLDVVIERANVDGDFSTVRWLLDRGESFHMKSTGILHANDIPFRDKQVMDSSGELTVNFIAWGVRRLVAAAMGGRPALY